MKVQYIDSFRFKEAEYVISDGNGTEIVLRMDYKNNEFSLLQSDSTTDEQFITEVQTIAEDLLQRKHGVNFAERK